MGRVGNEGRGLWVEGVMSTYLLVLPAQFSLYVHKGGLKTPFISFNFQGL